MIIENECLSMNHPSHRSTSFTYSHRNRKLVDRVFLLGGHVQTDGSFHQLTLSKSPLNKLANEWRGGWLEGMNERPRNSTSHLIQLRCFLRSPDAKQSCLSSITIQNGTAFIIERHQTNKGTIKPSKAHRPKWMKKNTRHNVQKTKGYCIDLSSIRTSIHEHEK